MGMIRPLSSATAMKRPGATSPCSGWSQRMRASTPTVGRPPYLDHRLVVQQQFGPLEGPVERVLGGHSIEHVDPEGLVEDLGSEAPSPFGLVHGRLGVGQQVVGIVGTEGVESHAHRGVEEHLDIVDRDRAGQRLLHPGDERRGLLLGPARRIRDESEELVAPEPGQQVDVSGHLLQTAGHRHEHLVAQGVTHRVVDGLEAVEVEQHHRHAARGAGEGLRRGTQPHLVGGPVGETRQSRHATDGPARPEPGRSARWGPGGRPLPSGPVHCPGPPGVTRRGSAGRHGGGVRGSGRGFRRWPTP